jgi:hypothetical protein
MQSLKILEKITFLILHFFQIIISWEGKLYFSAAFAVLLASGYFLERDYFVRTFRIAPWLLSVTGSVVWFVIALIEI